MANIKIKTSRFTKSENPRDKFIKFYINKNEFDDIKEQIDLLGTSKISTSEYCRYHVLGKKIVTNVDAKFIHELSTLGARLNKLGGLQKELFNNSPEGKRYANDTAKVLIDIHMAIMEITVFVRSMKNSIGSKEIK